MIKTVVKYFIFEKCIDVLFNNISTNFNNASIEEFNIGDRFQYIECKVLGTDIRGVFYDVLIRGTEHDYDGEHLLVKYRYGAELIGREFCDMKKTYPRIYKKSIIDYLRHDKDSIKAFNF